MKKIFFLSLLLFPFLSNAQSAKKNRKDSTVVIFFNENSSSSSSKKKKSGEDNIIKIAPLGFISGTFPITYERRIADFFSVSVSAGLTHKNFWRAIINNSDGNGEANNIKINYPWNPLTSSYLDQSAPLFNFDSRKATLGYMVSVQPRFYFESDACDGSFMGISLDYYRYNFTIPSIENQGGTFTQTGPIQKEHEKILDFMVCGGYQSVYDRLTVEYTTGVGLRSVKGEKYVYGWDGTNVQEGIGTYNQNVFNFNIGIKVGYHF